MGSSIVSKYFKSPGRRDAACDKAISVIGNQGLFIKSFHAFDLRYFSMSDFLKMEKVLKSNGFCGGMRHETIPAWALE